AVDALVSIPLEKRTQADFASLATALLRAGRDADALAAIETVTVAGRFDDGGELLRQLQLEIQRKTNLARALEDRALRAQPDEATALRDEAQQLRIAIGQPGTQPLRDIAAPAAGMEASRTETAPWPARTKTRPGVPSRRLPPAPVGSRPRPTVPPFGATTEASPASAPHPTGLPESAPSDPSPHGQPTPGLAEESSGVPIAALELPGDATGLNPALGMSSAAPSTSAQTDDWIATDGASAVSDARTAAPDAASAVASDV